MKKGILFVIILLLLLIPYLINSYHRKDINPNKKASSITGVTDSQKDNSDEKEVEFTEGIWIKKYPGDFASFKFETPDGYKIVCDPAIINHITHPDIVTESHQHADHCCTESLEAPYELLKEPGNYTIDDVIIQGYSGKHNKNDPMGTNIIFVFNINDITIAHFASQGEIPDNDTLKQIGKVDILLIQLFDSPDYDKLIPEDIDLIINQLNPKIIIPEHAGQGQGSLLAQYLNIELEKEASGNIVLTRKILDDTKGIRIINLYNDID